MSARYPRLAGPFAGTHPAVLSRRIHELVVVSVAGLIPLALGLAITVESPNPNPALVFGVLIALAVVLALLLSTRYEITLTIVALYLGLLDGPVKNEVASKATSGV